MKCSLLGLTLMVAAVFCQPLQPRQEAGDVDQSAATNPSLGGNSLEANEFSITLLFFQGGKKFEARDIYRTFAFAMDYALYKERDYARTFKQPNYFGPEIEIERAGPGAREKLKSNVIGNLLALVSREMIRQNRFDECYGTLKRGNDVYATFNIEDEDPIPWPTQDNSVEQQQDIRYIDMSERDVSAPQVLEKRGSTPITFNKDIKTNIHFGPDKPIDVVETRLMAAVIEIMAELLDVSRKEKVDYTDKAPSPGPQQSPLNIYISPIDKLYIYSTEVIESLVDVMEFLCQQPHFGDRNIRWNIDNITQKRSSVALGVISNPSRG